MKSYARIQDGAVAELLETDGDITEMFHSSLVWVECGEDVQPGWAYAEGAFSPPPQVPVPTPTELRAGKLDDATKKRWEVMTGGLTLPTGVKVGTTIDDQNRITSVVANAELAGLADSDEVDFKATNGWVRITIAQVKEIAGVIGQFVQACYSAERQHHEDIEQLEPEDFDSYDLDAHWPPTDLTEPAA